MHANGATLYIASDANSLYISEILKHHGVFECFRHIHTNPVTYDKAAGASLEVRSSETLTASPPLQRSQAAG